MQKQMLRSDLEEDGLGPMLDFGSPRYHRSARAPHMGGDDLDHELRMAAQLIMENAPAVVANNNQENIGGWGVVGAFGGGGGGGGGGGYARPPAGAHSRYPYRGGGGGGGGTGPLGRVANMYNVTGSDPFQRTARRQQASAAASAAAAAGYGAPQQQAFSHAAMHNMTATRPATAG